jgi:hypothetical protein
VTRWAGRLGGHLVYMHVSSCIVTELMSVKAIAMGIELTTVARWSAREVPSS